MTTKLPPPAEDWARPLSSPRLVMMAASTGGLAPLRQVLSGLPADFPAAVVVVQHRGLQHPELLPELLAASTPLEVRHARDGEPLTAGVVLVCPPGVHMTVEHCVRLIEGPKLEYVRPSADLMFRSAARTHTDRAIGVVLSGAGQDGALGCLALAQAGGVVIVQDAPTCECPEMPAAAMRVGADPLVLPPLRIAAVLQQLVVGCGRPPPARRGGVTRVLLADDHPILLAGLRALLRGERDIEVVGEAHDGLAAVELAAELAPDVVVIDISMPKLDGIEATRRIVGRGPSKVVALSALIEEHTVLRALGAGASAYLSKQTAFEELVRAIRAVAAGRVYLGPELAAAAEREVWTRADGDRS